MKDFLFNNRKQWKVCIVNGLKQFFEGLCRILFCLFFGLLSVIRYLWLLLVAFVKQNPKIAIIIFFVTAFFVWFVTFIPLRVQCVTAEHQRDSISYELSKIKVPCDIESDTTDIPNFNHWSNAEN